MLRYTVNLNYLDFHPDKVKWTKILYNKLSFLKADTNIQRGSPRRAMSSLFFLACDELLLPLNIKRNFHIKEIPVEDILKLIGQYVDDFSKVFCLQACLSQAICNFRVFRF